MPEVWSLFADDGSRIVDLEADELAEFPPLMDALAEIDRLRRAIRSHRMTGFDALLWATLNKGLAE